MAQKKNATVREKPEKNFFVVQRNLLVQLVDVHIFLVPKSIWKHRQNFAEDHSVDQAISLGFVRSEQLTGRVFRLLDCLFLLSELLKIFL